MKKIILAGATGLVGKLLFTKLQKKEYEVIIIARNILSAQNALPHAKAYLSWTDSKGIQQAIEDAYGIINLSGAPIVGKRWTSKYKKILWESRIQTTGILVNAITQVKHKPHVLINASAVGFYGIQPKKIFDETDPAGEDFLARLCKAWEQKAQEAEKDKVRVVCIRSGIILDSHEGALPKMLTPFSYFVGGPIGSGRQYFPWIHVEDEVGIIFFALENQNVTGPINSVSPQVVTNNIFAKTLGSVLNRPSWIPVPSFALTVLYGEAASVLITGVNVSSKKIQELGYNFIFLSLQDALRNLLLK